MLPNPPPRVKLANLPTPLRKLESLSTRFGQNIWLKADDQSGFTMSGNKVRKLEFLLADARQKGADLVITCGGVQSNHCRATAFACAQLGLRCHLILRNDPGYQNASSCDQANHFLDQLAGASFELHEPNSYANSLEQLFQSACRRSEEASLTPYTIPTGGSNGIGLWGYLMAFLELLDQCKANGFCPDLVVCASGSGGTQAGLCLGQKLSGSKAKVLAFAVCDDAHYFDAKVRADTSAWLNLYRGEIKDKDAFVAELNVDTNDRYIGPGYAQAYPELYNCIDEAAKRDGMMLDPTYTGKAFYGLIRELEQGHLSDSKNIVFVHTGGGFGLFPHAAQFL